VEASGPAKPKARPPALSFFAVPQLREAKRPAAFRGAASFIAQLGGSLEKSG